MLFVKQLVVSVFISFLLLLSACTSQRIVIPDRQITSQSTPLSSHQFAWEAISPTETQHEDFLALQETCLPVPFLDINEDLIEEAKTHLGMRYRRGGSSAKYGFDCSGFTAHVFKQLGYGLPRSSRQQSQLGIPVALDSVKVGDLLFFGRGSYINHTALVVSKEGEKLKIIHATRRGIVEDSTTSPAWRNYYARRFLFAKKIMQQEDLLLKVKTADDFR